MSALQNSLLGHTIRLITGGKVLAWPEQYDSNLVEAYLATSKPEEKPTLDRTSSDESTSSDNQVSKTATRIAIDWLENDPENPHNWSTSKKAWVSLQICLLTTSVYCGASIYTVGIEGIMEQFHVSQTVALLGLTLFIIGYGIGPMVWGPISELPAVGRTPVYVGTLLLFFALQPCIIYAKNIGMLLAFRFLTGIFGSPALALGGATAQDMFSPQKLNYAISFWGASAAFGPALGPIIASYAAQIKGWKWPIWELFILSGITLILLFCFLPETLEANILHRRAKRLQHIVNREGRSDTVRSRPDVVHDAKDSAKEGREILTQVFIMSIFEPIILVLNLYIALIYAILYLWFESLPLVFVGIYNFSLGQLGLAFIGILVGTIITVPFYWWYLRTRYEPLFTDPAMRYKLKPEISMEPAYVGCFFIPASMIMFAWSSRADVHWIVPTIATALFPMGAFPLFMAVLGYLSVAYPTYVASVFAGNDLMRAGFGAAFPLIAHSLFKTLGIDWGNTLLACLSALFIPVPFVLAKYGGAIRKMSKKAIQDEE